MLCVPMHFIYSTRMTKENYKAITLFNYQSIPQLASLSEEQKEAIEVVGRVLPFKTNSYVVNRLIDWNNIPDDPIFTLTLPRKEMLSDEHYNRVLSMIKRGDVDTDKFKELIREIRMQLNPNPAGQVHNIPMLEGEKLEGVQHKYRETVLFFPRQGQTCHAYCTFCFRWSQFSGMQELKFSAKEAALLFKYLQQHKEVSDLLLTGGDPLTMSTAVLRQYLEPLLGSDFKHIRTIRLGTKALAYWPYRFTSDADSAELIALFEQLVKAGKNLSVQAHFNHPVELSTDVVKEAIVRIRSTGAQIRTQSPVLRHINDKPEIWADMWRRQATLNCIPYYMFVPRDTGAKAFFELPLVQCWEIFRKAYSMVSGVCRTVRGPSMSATPGKVQILGTAMMADEKVFVLRFLQARDASWVHMPFFAKYDANATWLDQLQPAFGEENFFFDQQTAYQDAE